MIAPVQDRIPIYIAAIGPKNTQLVGEIADGWLPVFFSPDHVDHSRALLEEGAARSGRSLDGFDIAPTVQVSIDDDVDRARDAMRPFVALYVGGMGSRERNFYNALVRRYGFEDAAQEIQDLYLDGKKEEAAAAIPAELIDQVTMCGPRERVEERLEVYRQAGVGTLIVSPMALRAGAAQAHDPRAGGDALARMRRRRILLAAFGDPGHAFPAIALGRELAARGHEVTLETWERWREHAEREGMRFAAAPEYQVFPTEGRALKPYAAAVRAARGDARADPRVDPEIVVADILTVAAALAAELERRPWVTLVPHVLPMGEPGFPVYAVGAVYPRTAGRAPPLAARAPAC